MVKNPYLAKYAFGISRCNPFERPNSDCPVRCLFRKLRKRRPKRVGVCNPDPERLYIIFEVQNIGDGVANPITLRYKGVGQ